jgi:hypothetical protein
VADRVELVAALLGARAQLDRHGHDHARVDEKPAQAEHCNGEQSQGHMHRASRSGGWYPRVKRGVVGVERRRREKLRCKRVSTPVDVGLRLARDARAFACHSSQRPALLGAAVRSLLEAERWAHAFVFARVPGAVC